jgi:hypothetical protein
LSTENQSRALRFISPRKHFILVTCYLESFPSFLDPHYSHIGESDLVGGGEDGHFPNLLGNGRHSTDRPLYYHIISMQGSFSNQEILRYGRQLILPEWGVEGVYVLA